MEKKISEIEEFSNQNSSIRLIGYDPSSNKVGALPLGAITSKTAYCGCRWKKAESKPEGEPFGDLTMLANLPSILGLGGYLVRNDHSRRKLSPNNHKLFASGGVAALDGSMGHYQWGWNIPWYYAHWEDDIYECEAISPAPIAGHWNYKIPVASMSCSGAAALDRTNLILVSFCKRTAQYRGGDNKPDNDAKWNTLFGKPVVSVAEDKLQQYAEKNGARWGASMYMMVFALGALTRIIFHNRNIQAPYKAALTAEGLRQGGLGNGIDYAIDDFGKQYATLDIDALAERGDATGVFSVTIPKGDGTNKTINNIPMFFGLKNWYQYIYMMMHGCAVQATSSKTLDVYALKKWTSSPVDTTGVSKFTKIGSIPATSASEASWLYGKRMNLDNMIAYPLEFGGSGSTYYCDGFYHPAITSGVRGLAAFCVAGSGSYAGSCALDADSGLAVSSVGCGAFLCEADEDWDTEAFYVA